MTVGEAWGRDSVTPGGAVGETWGRDSVGEAWGRDSVTLGGAVGEAWGRESGLLVSRPAAPEVTGVTLAAWAVL